MVGVTSSIWCHKLCITLYMAMPYDNSILGTSNSFARRNYWNIYIETRLK
jgi:hypothetical protein